MKKKLKIAFDLLEKELQAASQNDLNRHKGGSQNNETISGFWAQEGLMFSNYNQPGGVQAYSSSNSNGAENDYSGNGFWTWGDSGWVWNGEGNPDPNAPHYGSDESGVIVVSSGSSNDSGYWWDNFSGSTSGDFWDMMSGFTSSGSNPFGTQVIDTTGIFNGLAHMLSNQILELETKRDVQGISLTTDELNVLSKLKNFENDLTVALLNTNKRLAICTIPIDVWNNSSASEFAAVTRTAPNGDVEIRIREGSANQQVLLHELQHAFDYFKGNTNTSLERHKDIYRTTYIVQFGVQYYQNIDFFEGKINEALGTN